MNKRYMDFVPSQAKVRPASSQASVSSVSVTKTTLRTTPTKASMTRIVPQGGTPRNAKVERSATLQQKEASKTRVVARSSAFSIKSEPELGVIEDLNPRFVNTNVVKRPLGHDANTGSASMGQTISSKTETETGTRTGKKGFGSRFKRKSEKVSKTVSGSVSGAEKPARNDKYVVPKSPFINQEKVVKRPLSKNVYPKKAEPAKPAKNGPVTIIAKPEKEAHTSLVVTIILTIILGAAAGTVAFLLLPK